MGKVVLEFTIYDFDVTVSGDDWPDIKNQAAEIAADLVALGPIKAPSSGKRRPDLPPPYVGEKFDGTTKDLCTWLEMNGPRPRSRIERESPFTKPRTLIKSAERKGLIEAVETLYERRTGGWGTMMAYYTANMERPKHPTPAEATPTVMAFAAEHEGYTPSSLEDRCGVVRSVAKRALTQLLLDKRLVVHVGDDKQGRVYLPGNSPGASDVEVEKA